MRPVRSVWNQVAGSDLPLDLLLLLALGAAAYLLFRHAEALSPAEGALAVLVIASLLRAGFHWWHWSRRLIREGYLGDWVHRTLEGARQPLQVPDGLPDGDLRLVKAMNAVIGDLQEGQSELAGLRHAMARDWQELDALLEALQRQHATEVGLHARGSLRLEALGRELKAALEHALRLDQVELNYRLRADQSRLQGQTFRSTLDQMRTGLEQFENLQEELQATFPRLRREEDALRRLADAGTRQGARLSLSVKGLVAHTTRLVDDTQGRAEWLRRLRHSADDVRDQTEALARRLEGFREEAQARIRSFGGARGSLKELDHVAQQTGLLAVNAAILAQQDGGNAGMATIGTRLRVLADQTAEGASGMKRTLEDYQLGLERETAGLWDLQEVTQGLLSEVLELLRTASQLDHQGLDLERALEGHVGLVDQVRQSSERVELSLQEAGARAMALEAVHGRQWGVEAKLAPELERLARMGLRLTEVGDGLARASQQSNEEIWDILGRHQELRRTEAYQQVTSEGLAHLQAAPEEASLAWNGIAWARAQRQVSLAEGPRGSLPPLGHHAPDGSLHLLLLGQDALHLPEVSALGSWACDPTGRAWDLHLLPSLRTESHRLGLLALLRESPIPACLPGLDMRIAPEGVHLRLPYPYPGFPSFLAGLRLELVVEPQLWEHPFREAGASRSQVQQLLWMGPDQGGGRQDPSMRLVHSWFKDVNHHEFFLPWLPYRGPRPPCPWLDDETVEDGVTSLPSLRCLGLGAEAGPLHPLRDRLLAKGAREGPQGLTFCAIGLGHPHPEALLLRLFQPDAELAGAFHPDLVPYQVRMRDEVLGGSTGDPFRAAWSILEDLHRAGWLMPLPPG